MKLRPMLAAPAGFLALTLIVTGAEAAPRFAMTCIENSTNLSLKYSTRWGSNGEWQSHSIAPGARTSHTWEYPRGQERRSPELRVKFDDDLSSKVKQREYSLESYASPQKTDCKRYGKEYRFRYDGSARKYIDLVGTK